MSIFFIKYYQRMGQRGVMVGFTTFGHVFSLLLKSIGTGASLQRLADVVSLKEKFKIGLISLASCG